MDLSIIIAHYDPGNHPDCLNSFKKTLTEISAQKAEYGIEIIIADDGSVSNAPAARSGCGTRDRGRRPDPNPLPR